MTSPSNIIQFRNQLETLENEAQSHLENSLESFRLFVSTLQVIQDSDLYKGSWDNYLRTRWHIADSTFRNWRAASSAAEIILSVVDSTVTKAQAAKVSRALSKLPNDLEIRLSAYAKAYEHTGKIVPSETELEIAYHEIDRVRKQDILTIQGIDYDAKALVIDENIKQELYELNKRKIAHIEASQGIESKRLEIGQNGALEALFQAMGMNVPQGHDFVLVWKEKRDE